MFIRRELETLITNVEHGNCYVSAKLTPKLLLETMSDYGELKFGRVKNQPIGGHVFTISPSWYETKS